MVAMLQMRLPGQQIRMPFPVAKLFLVIGAVLAVLASLAAAGMVAVSDHTLGWGALAAFILAGLLA
jgi:hypothetical protein